MDLGIGGTTCRGRGGVARPRVRRPPVRSRERACRWPSADATARPSTPPRHRSARSRSWPTCRAPRAPAGSCARPARRSAASTSSSPNAGGPPPGRFADVSDPQEYARAFELSCLSTIAMCAEAVPSMQAEQWGRVVAITSIAVRQPIPHLILSNTARAGLTGFLKTLAREVAPDGVTVNSLQPGLHDTERLRALGAADATGIPAGRLGRRRGVRCDRGVPVLGACRVPDRCRHPRRRRRERRAPMTGPVRHVVLLTWKEGTDAAAVRAVAEGLAALPDAIPELREYRFGADLGIADGNADFAIVGDFDDVEAWRRYQEHPEHQRVIVELIRPILASRAAVQLAAPGSGGVEPLSANPAYARETMGRTVLTIPNVISLLRLLCIPLFLWLLFGVDDRTAAFVLLGFLGATDWVDGWIARRYQQESDLGKILDPVADRAVLLTAAIALTADGVVSALGRGRGARPRGGDQHRDARARRGRGAANRRAVGREGRSVLPVLRVPGLPLGRHARPRELPRPGVVRDLGRHDPRPGAQLLRRVHLRPAGASRRCARGRPTGPATPKAQERRHEGSHPRGWGGNPAAAAHEQPAQADDPAGEPADDGAHRVAPAPGTGSTTSS